MESLLGFVVLVGLISLVVMVLQRRRKAKEYVEEHSERYRQAKEIINRYQGQFLKYPKHPSSHHAFDSKSKFDNVNNRKKVIDEFILVNKASLSEIVDAIEHNERTFKAYTQEVSHLLSSVEHLEQYTRREGRMVDKVLRAGDEFPSNNSFSLTYKLTYTSPKGQNHYEDVEMFSTRRLKSAIEEVEDNIEEKSEYEIFRDAERAKMTPGLRYDILKRDGFECQLCGASSTTHDVTLHVDHIQPVARGGKTEEDNLQTLCRDCNLGKGTKD